MASLRMASASVGGNLVDRVEVRAALGKDVIAPGPERPIAVLIGARVGLRIAGASIGGNLVDRVEVHAALGKDVIAPGAERPIAVLHGAANLVQILERLHVHKVGQRGRETAR